MDRETAPGGRAALQPEDFEVLAAVGNGSAWLRAVLCTLARRGAGLRLSEPERAAQLLEALAPLPFYKGGQFIFDLMEWEDFMVDGPPPPVVPTALDSRALGRLAELLKSVQAHLDGASVGGASGVVPPVEVVGGASAESLPLLEAGFRLYDDVVLGMIASAAPLARGALELRSPPEG